ncbi:hypothetical protein H0H87_003296, partial [Tephrocybe sp. NHM501043]
RRGEIEGPDLVIAGECEDEEDSGPDVKPVRVLSDFAIYDPKHSNEMVLLSAIEEDDGVDRLFEAEGIVSAYYANGVDEGEDDNVDEDGDKTQPVQKMVYLAAILRYTFDYMEAEG